MAPAGESQATAEEPVVEESLVEEVSIDGMCGVHWHPATHAARSR
jgi:mycofactocin precursor peptide MftA